MPYKTCSFCQQISYSANDKGSWLCPVCNADLGPCAGTRDIRQLTGLRRRKKGAICQLRKRRTV